MFLCKHSVQYESYFKINAYLYKYKWSEGKSWQPIGKSRLSINFRVIIQPLELYDTKTSKKTQMIGDIFLFQSVKE